MINVMRGSGLKGLVGILKSGENYSTFYRLQEWKYLIMLMNITSNGEKTLQMQKQII